MNILSEHIHSYVVSLYRELHEYPEIGFDLPKTVAVVKRELDAMGIAYSEHFGQCSVVAQIGERKDLPTVALRADMDALPVQETTGLSYASKIDGAMHACGHDSHTAIMLGVAKLLKLHENELNCNVRFLFQPSEEGAVSGAKMMVDNGCLEGVETCACTHCEPTEPTGTIGIRSGPLMAACAPITLRFYGITSHATLPEHGVDAVAMAVEAYTALKDMVRQEAADRTYIWSVGKFSGGEVHNVIPDLCTQEISFRFYDAEFAERVHQRALTIIDEIAKRFGGRAELDWKVSTCALHNDAKLVKQFCDSIQQIHGHRLVEIPVRKSSEDFAWYTNEVPGFLFRYGSRNEDKGCIYAPHRPDFKLDEDAFAYPVLAFYNFVMNYHK